MSLWLHAFNLEYRWQVNERINIWCLWPSAWQMVFNKKWVTSNRSGHGRSVCGIWEERWEGGQGKGGRPAFCFTRSSDSMISLLLISHVGSNLCVHMTDALMSELKVSPQEFRLAPSVMLSFEYAQQVAGVRRQACFGLFPMHHVSLAATQLFLQNKIH